VQHVLLRKLPKTLILREAVGIELILTKYSVFSNIFSDIFSGRKVQCHRPVKVSSVESLKQRKAVDKSTFYTIRIDHKSLERPESKLKYLH
jgi:hypothetical protein